MVLQGVIGCYMVLQGVAWCYRVRIIRCYRVQHACTWCFIVLLYVAGCCMVLHRVICFYTLLEGDHGVTLCYMSLHGVTLWYMVLHGVSGC